MILDLPIWFYVVDFGLQNLEIMLLWANIGAPPELFKMVEIK